VIDPSRGFVRAQAQFPDEVVGGVPGDPHGLVVDGVVVVLVAEGDEVPVFVGPPE
jgi:hypothetical protein